MSRLRTGEACAVMGDRAEIPLVLHLDEAGLELHGEVAGKGEGGKHGGVYDRNSLFQA
ncbi:MAG: hypothetical protein WCH98_18070 [Verrucomicrobiota bacterium]